MDNGQQSRGWFESCLMRPARTWLGWCSLPDSTPARLQIAAIIHSRRPIHRHTRSLPAQSVSLLSNTTCWHVKWHNVGTLGVVCLYNWYSQKRAYPSGMWQGSYTLDHPRSFCWLTPCMRTSCMTHELVDVWDRSQVCYQPYTRLLQCNNS